MRYLDTSVIVAAFTNEQYTDVAQAALRPDAGDPPVISDWVFTEMSGALSTKVRARRLRPRDRIEAWSAFTELVERTFTVLPISAAHFRTAAVLVEDPATGLRSGDALHLAVASLAQATMLTLDRGMSNAADLLQIPAVLLSATSR